MTDVVKTPEQVAAEEAAAAAKVAAEAGAAGSAPAGKTAEELQTELVRTQTLLEAANTEAATRRRKLKAYEDAEEARKTADMTELEKERKARTTAEERATKADANAREMLIRSAFVAESAKAGAAHPEDVYLLADKSGVEVSETGSVSGVAEAVKALVDAGRIPMSGKPPAPNLDGGAGGGERNHMGSVKLTPDEIEMANKMNVPLERAIAQKASLAKEAGAL